MLVQTQDNFNSDEESQSVYDATQNTVSDNDLQSIYGPSQSSD